MSNMELNGQLNDVAVDWKSENKAGKYESEAAFRFFHLGNVGLEGVLRAGRMACVKSLILCANGFDSFGAAQLGVFLAANATVTKLEVRLNHIGDWGVAAIARGLYSNKSLRRLCLWHVGLAKPGVLEVINLVQVTKALRVLHVGNNALGNELALMLLDAVVTSKTVTSLNLKITGITDSGIRGLVSTLRKNTTLRVLNVGYNKFGEAALMFGELLRTDRILHELKFSGCEMAQGAIVEMAKGLQQNTSLRRMRWPTMSLELERQCKEILTSNSRLVDCWDDFEEVCHRNQRIRLQAEAAAVALLIIRWFHDSIFSVLPKDVVKIIAKFVLESTADVLVWNGLL